MSKKCAASPLGLKAAALSRQRPMLALTSVFAKPMRHLAAVLLLGACLTPASPQAQQQANSDAAKEWILGRHYQRFDTIAEFRKSKSAGVVEVAEILSYACPACYAIEAKAKRYAATKPDYVRFEYVPAVFSQQLESIARLHFAVERWQGRAYLEEKMPGIFRFVIQKGRYRDFTSPDALEAFEKYTGVPQSQLEPKLARLSVRADVNRARRYVQLWGISSTPSFVVGGQYLVQPSREIDHDEVFEIIAYLVEKIRREK